MKSLIFGAILASLLMFGFVGADNTQGTDATVNDFITVAIAPLPTLSFGPVNSDSINNPATNGPVTFNPAGSTVDVTVEVTDVTGEPFATGLKFDSILAKAQKYDIPCVLSGEICTYTIKSVVPTLDVQKGLKAGSKTGVITYTLTKTIIPVPVEPSTP